MTEVLDIFERFKASIRDETGIRANLWLTRWSYQDRKSSSYPPSLPQDFYKFEGPDEIRRWMLWMSQEDHPSYIDAERELSLARKSADLDRETLRELELKPLDDTALLTIGRKNALDFVFAQPYPVPPRNDVQRILDFGAGFGRQANLWFQEKSKLVFVAVDGIPLSYCAQHYYLDQISPEFLEYLVTPDSFAISERPGRCYHLPTWRMDLLPDAFFDLIIAVQVLPEIGRKLLRHVIREFHRILKPGGAIYLRDHDRTWRPGHGINTNELLRQTGFELEFSAHIIDGEELSGVPRIWRKADPRVSASRRRTSGARMRDWKMVVDALTGGRLGRAYRRLFKTKNESS